MTITAIALGLALLGAPAEAMEANLQGWFAPSTQKVYKDTGPTAQEEMARVYAALGEYEAIQLCLRADADMPGMKVTVAPVPEPPGVRHQGGRDEAGVGAAPCAR
jgi:hypothetical protein